MIRDVKDVSALLDRRFGSAAGRPMSFARTLAWVLVGLYLFGLLFPAPKVVLSQTYYNKKLPASTRDLVLDKNDPRGWLHRKKDPSKFTIAWVGTSTMQNVAPGPWSFIPADVRARIPRIDGKPVEVNMYLFEGGRMLDLYDATKDALGTKPDLLLLDMNPLWLFNDRAIQGWPNLNGAVFGDLAGDPSSWQFVAAMDSPKDVALSAGGSHLSSLKDRWSYAQKLRSLIDKISPLEAPTPDPKAKGPTPGSLAYVATMQSPLAFWNYFRPLAPTTPNPRPLQEALLKDSVTDGSVINENIVNDLLGSLAGSKIPAIAYMPPIDPNSLSDPGVNAALHRVENHLAQLADKHRAKTLLVQSESAVRFLHGLKFKDLGHMTYSTPMVDYMAKLICSHLTSVDPATQCSPKPRTASK